MAEMNISLGATHAPLTKLVTTAIRERIMSGDIAVGARLVEGRLSEQLGVSRMPVREALRELAAEGIVTIEPRRGASVTAFTEEQTRELVEVRATLEALNAKLAAKHHEPKHIARLQRILEEGQRLGESEDASRIVSMNARFHDALATISGNSILQGMIRQLRDRTALLFASVSRVRVRQNWQEHAAILRAVIDGDVELAGLLAARHVYNAAQIAQDP
jgi:DNA-binding GntR family transcriptional regulator